MKALQPTQKAFLSSSSAEAIGLMTSLTVELQARVVEAHEKLVGVFLDHTVVGRDFSRIYRYDYRIGTRWVGEQGRNGQG